MKEMSANEPRTGRWLRIRQLVQSIGLSKRKIGGETRRAAYNDYWQVRNHRAAAPTTPSRK